MRRPGGGPGRGERRARAAASAGNQMLDMFDYSAIVSDCWQVTIRMTVKLVGRAHVDFLRVRSSLCRAS